MILLLLLVSVMCEPMEWTQLESPNGGLMSFMYQPFDTLIPSILDKTRFKIFTPEGDAIINDAMVYINWKTYTRSDGLFPTDVNISLYSVPGLSKDMEPNKVSVLAHSIPNTEVYMWIVRAPRSWSNDDFYLLRICSLHDDTECSYSSMFRILYPYAFYP